MIFILGIADMMASLIFFGQFFEVEMSPSMVVFFAGYLVLKGVIFVFSSLDLGSLFDIIAGGVLIAGIFFVTPQILLLLFGGILLIKGFFSLLA